MRVFPPLSLLLLCLMFGALPCRPTHAADKDRVEYATDDPYPTGSLRTARPTVAWRIAPKGGVQVTAVSLTLNNRRMDTAAYLPDRCLVSYTPREPLAPGRYAVHCTVTLDRDFTVENDWAFTVAPSSPAAGSGAGASAALTTSQRSLCDAVNVLRRRAGLPDAVADPRLCAAALGHSAYLARNGRNGHEQIASLPGFFGENPRDRCGAYGYPGDSAEDVGRAATPLAALRRLFDAPYHRAAFLQPDAIDIGTGSDGEVTTLLFAAHSAAAARPSIIVSPANLQQKVPLTWDGIETPNPLRVHPQAAPVSARQPLGYPITLHVFHAGETPLRNILATLTTNDNRPVSFYLNTPDNDEELRSGVILIPLRPLLPGTTYHVHVQASDAKGLFFARSWTFTTASAAAASRTR